MTKQQQKSRWCFQTCFYLHPYLATWSNLTCFCSNWLVQPPAKNWSCIFFCDFPGIVVDSWFHWNLIQWKKYPFESPAMDSSSILELKKSPRGLGALQCPRQLSNWENPKGLKQKQLWLVVSKICYFYPYLGKIPILTNIFQMGWNHQPEKQFFVWILFYSKIPSDFLIIR